MLPAVPATGGGGFIYTAVRWARGERRVPVGDSGQTNAHEDEAAFELGEPALVCRWRMAGRAVPLLNRHMRALSQRTVAGEPVARALVSWAKQHIEWSLADDTTVEVPHDGVLMLVVDRAGHAAMSVGPYEELGACAAADLAARAHSARREATETGIAPEVLCVARADRLVVGATAGEHLGGAATLVVQLAETKGIPVAFDDALAERILRWQAEGIWQDGVVASAGADRPTAADTVAEQGERMAVPQDTWGASEAPGVVLLVSDEHGVVSADGAWQDEAADSARALADLLVNGYETLLARADGQRGKRA